MIVAKYYKETALGQCLGFLWGWVLMQANICGEGACSRSAAKQSSNRQPRFCLKKPACRI